MVCEYIFQYFLILLLFPDIMYYLSVSGCPCVKQQLVKPLIRTILVLFILSPNVGCTNNNTILPLTVERNAFLMGALLPHLASLEIKH